MTEKSLPEHWGRYKTDRFCCPYCGGDADSIYYGFVEIDGNDAFQECTCNSCDRSWSEVYHLAGVSEEDGTFIDLEEELQ